MPKSRSPSAPGPLARPLRALLLRPLLSSQSDPRQTLRLRRFLMATGSYALWIAGLWYGTLRGFTDFSLGQMLLWTEIAVLIHIALYVTIRTGLNLRFADPSMTMLQIFIASCWVLVLTAHTRQARGLIVMSYFVTYFFGVFRLGLRQFLILSAFTISGYALILVNEQRAAPGADLRFDWLRFAVLAVLLMWLSWIGSYVAGLRERLAAKNAALEQALDKIRALAMHDELTQTYNRRHLMETLETECAKAAGNGRRLSVCLIDLDHFKAINDRHGHSAGDRILCELTACIEAQIRTLGPRPRDESFGRYGGEEFLLVLPHTGIDGALTCAERLRAAVAAADFRIGGESVSLTLSAGVAEYAAGEPVMGLLDRADAALYRAKADGRNCIRANGATAPAEAESVPTP